jgi:SAM-dependent methyltransferase
MARSDLYADEHHWGDGVIDVAGHDLPALKAAYLLDALPETGRVLEIGCGSGRVLNTIASHRPGLELHGCDIRPLRGKTPTFEFSQVAPDDSELPFGAASFDGVVVYDVLEHVVDPAQMLESTHRVLAPGGRLVSFTPLEDQPLSFYRMYRKLMGDELYVQTKEHLQAFSARSLRQIVEARFRIVECSYAYHLLGHFMDATLFAALKLPALRRRFWDENPFYAEDSGEEARAPSAFSRALELANTVAYEESRLLTRSSFGAAGMLFTAVPRG